MRVKKLSARYYKKEKNMKKLMQKSVNLTKPTLSVKYFVGFALVVVMMTVAVAFGKKIHAYLAGATTKARGHIEESGILPGE